MEEKNHLPPLLLRILTPEGVLAEVRCDAVQLTLSDDTAGRGGGGIGIRRGHAEAILALQRGPVSARTGSEEVYRATLRGGFAAVRHDVITVLTDGAAEEEQFAKAPAERYER